MYGPPPTRILICTSKETVKTFRVEYEGYNAFCSYCGLIGYMVGLCRKRRVFKETVNGVITGAHNDANVHSGKGLPLTGVEVDWVR